jgi:parallel beta-helix repeat protein
MQFHANGIAKHHSYHSEAVMKHFTRLFLVLALAAWLGCDKSQSPTSSPEKQARPESLAKFQQQVAEAKPKFEQNLTTMRAKVAQYKAKQSLEKKSSAAAVAGATIRVPDDYPTIQAAIDAAAPGTKVLVKAGTYTEDLTITTPDLRLTGSGAVTLDGFIIVGGTSGVQIDHFTFGGSFEVNVFVVDCSGVTVKDNTFSGGSFAGLAIFLSSDCTVKHNVFSGNFIGALIEGGGGNTLDENTGTGNLGAFVLSVLFAPTFGNTLSSNSASANEVGIFLGFTADNTLKDNVCNGNASGIILADATGNTVGSKNTANANTDVGIFLDSGTSGNEVNKNTALGNGTCDIVNEGTGNTFSKNTAGCTSGF